MNSQTEIEIDLVKDTKTVEEALQALWQKVKGASDTISQLREENQTLRSQFAEIEREVSSLRGELTAKEHELKRLRMEHAQYVQSNGSSGFSQEEKDILKTRIRELIAKINSHLS